MRNWHRLFSVAFALLLGLTGTLAFADGMPTPEPNVMPIANGDITLSIYVSMPNEARQKYTTLADHPVVKQIAAETGLNFEFIIPRKATTALSSTPPWPRASTRTASRPAS